MLISLWRRIKIGFYCGCVMILTAFLIGVFYIATFIRRLFVKDFVPTASKHTIDESEETIGSAQAQLNAIQATLEKK